MFKSLKILIPGILIFSFIFIVVGSNITKAGTYEQVINGFADTGKEAGYPIEDQAPKNEFVDALMIYTNFMMTMMGGLLFILIIYGGFLWMTARGNEEKVKRGYNFILYATIGFVIVVCARIAIELIIDNIL